MAKRQPASQESFLVPSDGALIGLVFDQDGCEVTRYFAGEVAADAVAAEAREESLQLIGAWSDLDWEEMGVALERIRRDGTPSPPIEV